MVVLHWPPRNMAGLGFGCCDCCDHGRNPMSAAEVINRNLGVWQVFSSMEAQLDFCHAIVDGLKDEGYAVVELPAHQVWDGPGRERYWRVDDTTVSVDKFNVATVSVSDDWDDLGADPDQFRALAAALLAAADIAEANA